jgi:hypothetical protein
MRRFLGRSRRPRVAGTRATVDAARPFEIAVAGTAADAAVGRRLYDRLRRHVRRPHRTDYLPSPTSPRSPRSRRGTRASKLLAASAAAAAIAALLGGCGSSNPGGTSADPARAVPASAVLYAGATVRPKGTLAKDALAAAHALTHQANPYLRLLAALQTPGSPALNYKTDVAPWLGPHAGIFLTSLRSASALVLLLERGLLGSAGNGGAFPFGAGGAEGALVLDTSNIEKARSFLDTQAARAGAHATSYRGVHFQSTAGGVAFGLVDRFAVIGSEAGLRGVIEASTGGSSLAHTAGYTKLLAAAPANALAHLYARPSRANTLLGGEGLGGILHGLSGSEEADLSLVTSPTSLTLDADTLAPETGAGSGGLLSADPESAPALGELPGESWLAIGLGHVGATLSKDAQDIQGLAALAGTIADTGPTAPTSAFSLGSLLQGLITPLRVLGASSAQAKAAFASWMGSAGIFAGGSSLLELHAAVVFTSKDPARSRAAVGELAAQLRSAGGSVSHTVIPGTNAAVAARLTGLPLVLDIANGVAANGQTKFVLGLGEASVTSALNPSSTLTNAASRATAASSLGEGIQPSLIVNFPTLLGLFEGVGLLEQPPISQFLPYLRTLTTLAGGGRQLEGGVQRLRLTIGLQ